MAERKVEKVETEPLNLDKNVLVKNIADWDVGFARKASIGDVTIVPRGQMQLSIGEIIVQSQSGNKLFNGTDGMGSHATLIIDDLPTRVELGFESADGKRKQLVFSDDLVKEVFDIKNQNKFEEAFKESFVTRSEHIAVIEAITRLGINDFAKIRFAEEFTGFKVK